ncbi:hypothetical protein [Nocardia noduli]|uniref:hypothetical protein n=1 Tax=Nocardia noduli TaxID=2815722 RepID=UPI003F684DD8
MSSRRSCAASVPPNYWPRNAARAGTAATPATNYVWPRARELADQGPSLEAACRIIVLEDQLAEAVELNAELTRQNPPDLGH